MNGFFPRRKPADVLVADIGSTITKLSAFGGLKSSGSLHERQRPRFLGQGTALTTVDAGDVGLGFKTARRDLENRFGVNTAGSILMASSSAAGGLRMTVHGLTKNMTLRAAREASLGAGAIVTFTTAGRIHADDLVYIQRTKPNIILLAGGVDYGDRDIVLANARALASLHLTIPLIYAGNKAVRIEVKRILQPSSLPVFMVDNVYPQIDELNIDPVRQVIQDVFARHIVTAPGMEKVKKNITGDIMPTPAAVMQSTRLLAEVLGDVMTVDVGGATTDVHSVTDGSPEYKKMTIAPEPRFKRTVEGDLGVYINAGHIAAAAGEALQEFQKTKPIPDTAESLQTAVELTRWAASLAVRRHAGRLRVVYGTSGRNEIIEGRDLTAIRYVIATGGALTRLGAGVEILKHIRTDIREQKLLPPQNAQVLLDRNYIMAAAGVLSQHYPKQAESLLLESLGWPP